tara:strand:- start:154 stop:660 length:507 start_codon:yes stop_codon:yes gene_type:complete
MTSIIKVDTIQTSAGGSPTASSLGIGGVGKIGQQVHGTSSTQITDSSGAFIDTGLTVNITPTSTSSKINLIGSMMIRMDAEGGTDNGMKIRFMRDSTSIWEGDGNQIYLYTNGTYAETNFQWTQAIIDEPSTTSQITYKIQTERSGNTRYNVMWQSKPGFIIAQEVLA